MPPFDLATEIAATPKSTRLIMGIRLGREQRFGVLSVELSVWVPLVSAVASVLSALTAFLMFSANQRQAQFVRRQQFSDGLKLGVAGLLPDTGQTQLQLTNEGPEDLFGVKLKIPGYPGDNLLPDRTAVGRHESVVFAIETLRPDELLDPPPAYYEIRWTGLRGKSIRKAMHRDMGSLMGIAVPPIPEHHAKHRSFADGGHLPRGMHMKGLGPDDFKLDDSE